MPSFLSFDAPPAFFRGVDAFACPLSFPFLAFAPPLSFSLAFSAFFAFFAFFTFFAAFFSFPLLHFFFFSAGFLLRADDEESGELLELLPSFFANREKFANS